MYGNQDLTKSFLSTNIIQPYTIVKFDAAESTVITAAASTDLLLGVTNEIGFGVNSQGIVTDIAMGNYVDVILDGIAQVVLGGAVTRGQKLTSNGTGQAITAAPGAGVNAHIIGIAFRSGVAGDVIPVLIEQSVMQG